MMMTSEECMRYDHAFCMLSYCGCNCHLPQPEDICILEIKGVKYAMPKEWAEPIIPIYGVHPQTPNTSDLLPYVPVGTTSVQYFPPGKAPDGYVLYPGKLGNQPKKAEKGLNGKTIGQYLLGKMKGMDTTIYDIARWVREVGVSDSEVPYILDAMHKRGDIYEISKDHFRTVQ